LQVARELDGVLTVAGLADDLKSRFERKVHAHTLAYHAMVVGNQEPGGHHCPP